MKTSVMLLAFSVTLSAQFAPAPYSPLQVGSNPRVVVVDTYSDTLFAANTYANTVTALLYNSGNGFTAPYGGPFTVGKAPASIAAGIFGYPAELGFATANTLDNTISVLAQSGANGGTSGFAPIAGSPFQVGKAPASIAAGNFQGLNAAASGNDLAVANSGDNTLTVLLATATGGFAAAPHSPFPVGSNPASVVLGFFTGYNSDYTIYEDLAVANDGDNTVTVLLGNGMGDFTAAPGSPFTVGKAPIALAAGDFNGDGIQDLAVANSGDNTVTVLLADATGRLTAPAGPFAVGKSPASVAVGDFNGDGFADLAVANSGDNTVTVLLGDGKGGFAAAPFSPLRAGSQPSSVAVADFNFDGNPDLAVANFGDNTITILLNSLPTPMISSSAMVSAASGLSPVATGSLIGIYGADLAPSAMSAATLPLPVSLNGTSVNIDIVDIIGIPVATQPVPLLYVSPTQINAQIPPVLNIPTGQEGSAGVFYENIRVTTAYGSRSAHANITFFPAPGLFSANQTGAGVAAAQFVTNQPDGTQTIADVFQCSGGAGTCVSVPLDVTAGSSALVLYGTGISATSNLSNVGATVTIGSQTLPAFYAGPSPAYAGEDQVNVLLPASLAGSGTVNVTVTVSGAADGAPFTATSNAVTVRIP